MRVPQGLSSLVEHGVVDEVLRPLMAGKEAEVYLVRSRGETRVAKVYKHSHRRSFKHRVEYTEGRKVKNSRQQRAMNKRSRYGREELEAAWHSAEVDTIYRLSAAGVRVPEPYDFIDGVLIMELIADERGAPAPRLVDVELSRGEARKLFDRLLREVVKMLCAGVVHADLSDFNILLSPDGPVLIDFPQAVDPSSNRNARKLLIRDVRNLTQFLSRWDKSLRRTKYAEEMWALYEKSALRPDTVLTGKFRGSNRRADTMSLLEEIEAVEREARRRREALGLPPPRPARRPVVREEAVPAGGKGGEGTPEAGAPRRRRRRRRRRPGGTGRSSSKD